MHFWKSILHSCCYRAIQIKSVLTRIANTDAAYMSEKGGMRHKSSNKYQQDQWCRPCRNTICANAATVSRGRRQHAVLLTQNVGLLCMPSPLQRLRERRPRRWPSSAFLCRAHMPNIPSSHHSSICSKYTSLYQKVRCCRQSRKGFAINLAPYMTSELFDSRPAK